MQPKMEFNICWQTAIIIPIYKDDAKREPCSYKRVSITFITMVFNKLVPGLGEEGLLKKIHKENSKRANSYVQECVIPAKSSYRAAFRLNDVNTWDTR